MATLSVNGTSIQTAANNAQAGDTLDVKGSVGYAGFSAPTGKKLTIIASDGAQVLSPVASGNVVELKGTGSAFRGFDVSGGKGKDGCGVGIINAADVVVEDVEAHHNERGHAFRVYGSGAVRPIFRRVEGHHVASGLHVDGGGAGGRMEDAHMHDIDRMLVNDPAPGTDTGGMAFAFKRNNGLFTVHNARSERAYSVAQQVIDPGEPSSNDYGWDGAHVELFESGPVSFTADPGKGYFWGSPWILETGKNSAGPDCKQFTIRGYDVWGQWPGTPPTVTEFGKQYTRANVGFLLRSAVDFLIEGNRFHDLDYYLLGLVREGNYATGSTVDKITVQDNEVWLKAASRFLSIGSGITLTPSTLTERRNKVYVQAGGSVASVLGKGATGDLATYRGWAPPGATWGEGDYWGPYVAPPAADPCLPVKTERDTALAALAAANAALTASDGAVLVLTRERDGALARLDAAKQNALGTLAL